MRGRSHRCLGEYLAQRYMSHISQAKIQAFLFGCTQPDRNPVTYLKGSFRHQWLRGHNYRNARRFIRHISFRLEQKKSLNLYDYYTLGKLIHYTADAFTFAHNDDFPTNLKDHRAYEAALQEHFLNFLQEDPQVDPKHTRFIIQSIRNCHHEYQALPRDIRTDSRYALTACCGILTILFVKI